MKGFIRRRGDAWELRVCLGTDPMTNNSAARHGFSPGPTIGPGKQQVRHNVIIQTVLTVVLPDDEQPTEGPPI